MQMTPNYRVRYFYLGKWTDWGDRYVDPIDGKSYDVSDGDYVGKRLSDYESDPNWEVEPLFTPKDIETTNGEGIKYLRHDSGGLFPSEFPSEYITDPVNSPTFDGGPSGYYDFQGGWNTINDYIEHKSERQWGPDSFHWGNVTKALARWGDKKSASKPYDARKVIYSGCRVLKRLVGKDELRSYLQSLLDEQQFK